MLIVTSNLTYVDNGIIAEVMASDMPANSEEDPGFPMLALRHVYTNREEALAFIAEEIAKFNPRGKKADVLVFRGKDDNLGNA